MYVYQQFYQAYLDEQAGLLASQLEEGMPCMVSVSYTHLGQCMMRS